MGKIKVTVKPKKSGNSGTLIARVPVAVVRTQHPSGERMYQTKAQVLVNVKMTSGGRPRIRYR